MNRLPVAKRAQILSLLCEGSSMRSVARLAGVSINTVTKLLVDAGRFCAQRYDEDVRGVRARRVQVDETWTGICADSKLIISWLVGGRGLEYASPFMNDLRARLVNRVQLTSDGDKAYLQAVDEAFGEDVDFAQLIKIYGGTTPEDQRRYSPAECIGCTPTPVTGNPNPKHISTSFAERQNLSMRMHMRRFRRLTNGFSKKLENHIHMVALYTVFYNLVRVHKTLKTTPAVAAGIADRVWTVTEICNMMEEASLVPATHR
jgi:hypothetical protein